MALGRLSSAGRALPEEVVLFFCGLNRVGRGKKNFKKQTKKVLLCFTGVLFILFK